MKLFGELRSISTVQTFENSDTKKQEIVLVSEETGVPYKICFFNQKIELLKDLKLGGSTYVEFYIQGNFYDKKNEKGVLTGEKDVINSFVASNFKQL